MRCSTTGAISVQSICMTNADGRYTDGAQMLFTYNCDMSDGSAHVEWRNRSPQIVTVIARCEPDEGWEESTLEERDEAAMPWSYTVRWDDGFEGDVFEDELAVIVDEQQL